MASMLNNMHNIVALASFIGSVYKKYSIMDPTSILIYLVKELQKENFFDLIILKELLVKMTGADHYSITSHQYSNDLLTVGPIFKAEIFSIIGQGFTQNTTTQNTGKSFKKSSARLLRSLFDNNLIGWFLILIAKMRISCLSCDSVLDQTKVTSNWFDQVIY